MTCLNHTVEQIASLERFVSFNGLNGLSFTVTVPDWHEPFPINGQRTLECFGLYTISHAWYINGPVVDQFSISTGLGQVKVPAGSRIVSQELPEKWEANGKNADPGKRQWHAYTNGRTAFC